MGKKSSKRRAEIPVELTPTSTTDAAVGLEVDRGTKKKWLGILFLVGFFLRIPFLTQPNQVVFDEVHFGKFISSYCCTAERFFDVHPPHAKLLIALFAKIGGYKGNFKFEKIGDSYSDANIPIFGARFIPALTGIALPLIIFTLMLQLGASLPAAVLASFFIALDSAWWVQTRIISLDGVLLVAIFGSISALLAAERRSTWKEKIPFLILCGFSCGWALGTKLTGLTGLGLCGVWTWRRFAFERTKANFKTCLSESSIIGALTVVTYVVPWIIHFAILSEPGSGDAYYRMTGNFFVDFIEFQKVMFRLNANLTTPHHDASTWWTWPWMGVPVYYWVQNKGVIYFVGNPVVWWGCSLMFIVASVVQVLPRATSITLPPTKLGESLWLPFLGFMIAYAPYVGVSRPLFLYHYLPPLVFSVMYVILWLDRMNFTMASTDWEGQRKGYFILWGLLIAGFIIMLPFTSGLQFGDYYRGFIFKRFTTWP